MLAVGCGCSRGPRSRRSWTLPPPGAVICCLAAGRWVENIRISKSLVLKGQGADQTVLVGKTAAQPVIWIQGQGEEITVLIEGLSVQGPSTPASVWDLPHGLVIQGSARVTIREVTVANHSGFGIWVSESARATIQRTLVAENEYGICLSDEAQATLEEVRVARNYFHNIELHGGSRATITNSLVTEAGNYGISVMGQAQALVRGCQIRGGSAGIVLGYQARATVEDTLVQDASIDGVLLLGEARLILLRTTIMGNDVGIAAKHLSSLQVLGCTIRENGVGIGLRHYSSAIIRENSIVDNFGYGVAFVELGCFPGHPALTTYAWSGEEGFRGSVAGAGNTISGNQLAPVCPTSLEFLATEEGGAIDLGE